MTKELRFAIGGGLACMLLLLLVFAPGCTKIPNGGIPFYLLVDSPTVVNDGIAGSTSNQIPDVWVQYGNTDIGAYQTPVRVPILAQGNVFMLLSAGIYDNGIISSRAAYPFYRSDTFTIPNVIPGHVYTHHPVYHYFANTQHGLLEGFDNTDDFTNIVRESTDVFEGTGSGIITMGPADTTIIATQRDAPAINTNGRDAYVEMNYKMSDSTSVTCDVGIQATTATGTYYYTLITLLPRTQWTKIYLNFSNWLGTNQGANFQVYFVTYKAAGATGAMYFDNVKLLYFD